MLEKLGYRSRRVFELRYGLDGRDSCALDEVGRTLTHFMLMGRCATGQTR
jgi:DNA-directed RNA polymerase sigma subunit (sigma70/sigma32)